MRSGKPRSQTPTHRPQTPTHTQTTDSQTTRGERGQGERGQGRERHALWPVPIARVDMRLIALCVAGAAAYDATGRALTVR